MYPKGIAIVTVSPGGVEIALKIKAVLDKINFTSDVHVPAKYAIEGVLGFDDPFDEFIKRTYSSVNAIIAVMANGIIIRTIAPYIKGKLVDPAVVGVDVAGKFVTSLLSGHYGGANELARLIATGIGAIPVVTTASDVLGKQSIDMLAQKLHLTITNPKSLVPVNASIVNGERVVLVLMDNIKVSPDQIISYDIERAENLKQALSIVKKYPAGAIITKSPISQSEFPQSVVILKLRQFTLGLGARKDITVEQIRKAITTVLNAANVPIEWITQIATVDIKKDSQSMIKAVQSLGFNLKFISVDELRDFKHEDLSPDSRIVQKNIGVGGVCERAALIVAGKNAHLILKKQKLNSVTMAIAAGE